MNEIIRDYNKNGFCVIKSIIKQENIDHILEKINKLFKQQLFLLKEDFKCNDDIASLSFNMKQLFNKDLKRYLKVVGVLSRLNSISKLFLSDEIEDIVEKINIKEKLICTTPVFHIMSQSLKIPNGYFGFAPHQDFPSIQGSLDCVVIWVPLMDIDKNLYPLEIIPKSNHRGMLAGNMKNNCYEVDRELYSESDFVPVEVEAGDIVLMSSFTIHRSSINGKKDDIRLATSFRFDNVEEESFIDRCYPSVYHRIVKREILDKNFPSLQQVKNIFK